MVPYVEIMLDARREGASRFPQETYFIDEVIIGPTPEPELSIEVVEALFAGVGKEVRVKKSDIPYRNW